MPPDTDEPVYGALEAGGTNFNCALVSASGKVLLKEVIRTTDFPDDTLDPVGALFKKWHLERRLVALGVASFGPVDLDRTSASYGSITTTPKPGWGQVDVIGALRRSLNEVTPGRSIPIGWDTDTNGAALGEYCWGPNRGTDPLVYVTVGTGVGIGVILNNEPIHGLMHPEGGHLAMPAIAGDDWEGACTFHGRCLEGLTSGFAIEKRTGRKPETIPLDDPVWDLVAQYLAYGFYAMSLVVSPKRIVVGGGVGRRSGLLDRVRGHFLQINHSYVSKLADPGFLDNYLVKPGLDDRSGIMGAFELARREEAREGRRP